MLRVLHRLIGGPCLRWLARALLFGGGLATGITATTLAGEPLRAIAPKVPPAEPLTADQLLRHEVVNSGGVSLARIEELIIDNGGRIRYVILSYSGVLPQVQYILAPWQVLTFTANHPVTITLDMVSDELKDAPRIGRMPGDDWPSLAFVNWPKVDRFYVQMFAKRGSSLSSLKKEFDLMDRDHSGYLKREEAALLPELADHFALADSNHDWRLSEGEFIRFESGARR